MKKQKHIVEFLNHTKKFSHSLVEVGKLKFMPTFTRTPTVFAYTPVFFSRFSSLAAVLIS